MQLTFVERSRGERSLINGVRGRTVTWLERAGSVASVTMRTDTLEVPRSTKDPSGILEVLRAAPSAARLHVSVWDDDAIGVVAVSQ